MEVFFLIMSFDEKSGGGIMKKESYRQILIALIGALMCRFGIGGYYPFLPAYYAAALLRGEGRALLGGVMFLGMAFTLPVTETGR